MAFIDYTKFNFCTRCEFEFSKEKGSKCPQCGYQARTLPRNPKIFKEAQNPKIFKAQNSEIWSHFSGLEAGH